MPREASGERRACTFYCRCRSASPQCASRARSVVGARLPPMCDASESESTSTWLRGGCHTGDAAASPTVRVAHRSIATASALMSCCPVPPTFLPATQKHATPAAIASAVGPNKSRQAAPAGASLSLSPSRRTRSGRATSPVAQTTLSVVPSRLRRGKLELPPRAASDRALRPLYKPPIVHLACCRCGLSTPGVLPSSIGRRVTAGMASGVDAASIRCAPHRTALCHAAAKRRDIRPKSAIARAPSSVVARKGASTRTISMGCRRRRGGRHGIGVACRPPSLLRMPCRPSSRTASVAPES
eukprot:365042-Chlamydomonas_euryale.AAC.16